MSHAKNKPHIIELLGLPGSGKSTVARALAERIDAELIPNETGRKETAVLLFRHPLITLAWLLFILRESAATRTFGLMRLKISLVFNTLARIKRAQRSEKEIVIVDEGFFQRILSIAERTKQHKEVMHLLKLSILPHHVLIIEMQEPTFGRYKDDHVRNSLGEAYVAHWKEVTAENYELVRGLIELPHTLLTSDTDMEAFVSTHHG